MAMEITLDKLIRMAESAKFEADEASRAAQQAANWITTSREHAVKAQFDADRLSQALAAIYEGRLRLLLPTEQCHGCGLPVPAAVVEGGQCAGCDHVFGRAEDDK